MQGDETGATGLRERLAERSRAEVVGAAVLVIVVLAAVGLWWGRSSPRPMTIEVASPAMSAAATTATPSVAASPVLVHVAGAVRAPGVYRLEPGQRIVDAIEAAGGARRGAALDSLNLAAPLVDGTQVFVPGRGATGGAAPVAGIGGVGASSGLLNLNTATAAQLEALPGIGEVIAQRIVDYRTSHGPFASVDDLLSVSGIGDATLADIRDLVTV